MLVPILCYFLTIWKFSWNWIIIIWYPLSWTNCWEQTYEILYKMSSVVEFWDCQTKYYNVFVLQVNAPLCLIPLFHRGQILEEAVVNVNVKSSWCPCAETTRYLWFVMRIIFWKITFVTMQYPLQKLWLLHNWPTTNDCYISLDILIKVDISFFQPPPPELGYTITVKDLDMEKKATLTQIQKVLEEPGECSYSLLDWFY